MLCCVPEVRSSIGLSSILRLSSLTLASRCLSVSVERAEETEDEDPSLLQPLGPESRRSLLKPLRFATRLTALGTLRRWGGEILACFLDTEHNPFTRKPFFNEVGRCGRWWDFRPLLPLFASNVVSEASPRSTCEIGVSHPCRLISIRYRRREVAE